MAQKTSGISRTGEGDAQGAGRGKLLSPELLRWSDGLSGLSVFLSGSIDRWCASTAPPTAMAAWWPSSRLPHSGVASGKLQPSTFAGGAEWPIACSGQKAGCWSTSGCTGSGGRKNSSDLFLASRKGPFPLTVRCGVIRPSKRTSCGLWTSCSPPPPMGDD